MKRREDWNHKGKENWNHEERIGIMKRRERRGLES